MDGTDSSLDPGDADDRVVARLNLIRELKAAQLRRGNRYSETAVKRAMADAAGVGVRAIEKYLKGGYPLGTSESLEGLDAWARKQFPSAYPPADDPVSLVHLWEIRTRQLRDRASQAGDPPPAGATPDDSVLSVEVADERLPADENGAAGLVDDDDATSTSAPAPTQSGLNETSERRSRGIFAVAGAAAAVVLVTILAVGVGRLSGESGSPSSAGPSAAVTTAPPSSGGVTSTGAVTSAGSGSALPSPSTSPSTKLATRASFTFDALGTDPPYVRVYPGTSENSADKAFDATFRDHSRQAAICWQKGRQVNSDTGAGEPARSSRIWIGLEAPPDQLRFATLVYGELSVPYRQLPDCAALG